MQTLLTNTNLSDLSLSFMVNLLPLHQVFICETHIFPQLHQFWNKFQIELVKENLYKASISSMRLKLPELQKLELEAQKLRAKKQLLDDWEDIKRILYYQGLLLVPEII